MSSELSCRQGELSGWDCDKAICYSVHHGEPMKLATIGKCFPFKFMEEFGGGA